MWGELSSECGASCLGASFLWGELSWGELSLGRVVLIPSKFTLMSEITKSYPIIKHIRTGSFVFKLSDSRDCFESGKPQASKLLYDGFIVAANFLFSVVLVNKNHTYVVLR